MSQQPNKSQSPNPPLLSPGILRVRTVTSSTSPTSPGHISKKEKIDPVSPIKSHTEWVKKQAEASPNIKQRKYQKSSYS